MLLREIADNKRQKKVNKKHDPSVDSDDFRLQSAPHNQLLGNSRKPPRNARLVMPWVSHPRRGVVCFPYNGEGVQYAVPLATGDVVDVHEETSDGCRPVVPRVCLAV